MARDTASVSSGVVAQPDATSAPSCNDAKRRADGAGLIVPAEALPDKKRGRKAESLSSIVATVKKDFNASDATSIHYGDSSNVVTRSIGRYLSIANTKLEAAGTSTDDARELTQCIKELTMIDSCIKMANAWNSGGRSAAIKFEKAWSSLMMFINAPPIVCLECDYIIDLSFEALLSFPAVIVRTAP
jgi:hypothetical protein